MLNTKEDITNWLEEMKIENYTIHDDLTVDVNGTVYLSKKELTSIPVQFGKVESFMCQDNQLVSLKGCPHTVKSLFNCNHNQLTSLEFGPTFVGKSYGCANNLLTSLKGIVNSLSGDLNCSHNQLISLDHLPSMQENFDCSHNALTSLLGCPKKYLGIFDCSFNQLTSLEGAPEVIFQLSCSNNLLTSLNCSIIEIESRFHCHNNPIVSLQGCTTIIGDKFFHNISGGYPSPISEFRGLYEYDNNVHTLTIEIEHNHFNAITHSQKLDSLIPDKTDSKKKIKI